MRVNINLSIIESILNSEFRVYNLYRVQNLYSKAESYFYFIFSYYSYYKELIEKISLTVIFLKIKFIVKK